MAAAAATGSKGATQATIPVGSGLMIPVREGAEEVVFDVEGVEIAELQGISGGDWQHIWEGIADIFTGGGLIGVGISHCNPLSIIAGIYNVGAGIHNTISGALDKNTRLITISIESVLSTVGKLQDHRPWRSVIYDRDR
jgi:hypothetical protein